MDVDEYLGRLTSDSILLLEELEGKRIGRECKLLTLYF